MSKYSEVLPLIVITLSLFLLGTLLLWYSTTLEGPAKVILQGISALVVTSGVFSMWGSYIARYGMTRGSVEELRYVRDLREIAGVTSAGQWPQNIPADSTKVDIVAMRGVTWFQSQADRISSVLENENSEIRICLLHPEFRAMSVIASKLEATEKEMKEKILFSIKSIVERAEKPHNGEVKGRLTIKLHNLVPTHTYYRFDENVFVVWYALRRGWAKVPLLQLQDGALKDFFTADFERFWDEHDTEFLYENQGDNQKNFRALKDIGVSQEELDRVFI